MFCFHTRAHEDVRWRVNKELFLSPHCFLSQHPSSQAKGHLSPPSSHPPARPPQALACQVPPTRPPRSPSGAASEPVHRWWPRVWEGDTEGARARPGSPMAAPGVPACLPPPPTDTWLYRPMACSEETPRAAPAPASGEVEVGGTYRLTRGTPLLQLTYSLQAATLR